MINNYICAELQILFDKLVTERSLFVLCFVD